MKHAENSQKLKWRLSFMRSLEQLFQYVMCGLRNVLPYIKYREGCGG
jgi:hypothetical protein